MTIGEKMDSIIDTIQNPDNITVAVDQEFKEKIMTAPAKIIDYLSSLDISGYADATEYGIEHVPDTVTFCSGCFVTGLETIGHVSLIVGKVVGNFILGWLMSEPSVWVEI